MSLSSAALLAVSKGRRPQFDIKRICFPQQLRAIEDPARLKAIFTTRRGAKSFTAGVYLIKEALENPGSNGLFLALTRFNAMTICWRDIFKVLDQKYNLGIRFNETTLVATFPNGSVIYVAGCDQDEAEMNKLLGRKYKLAVVDEASMFTINVHQLVYGVLKPACADQRGTICLIGTSSNICRGLFFDVTTGREPGWSLHQWGALNNPHVAVQWQEELDDIAKNRPLFMQTALFKQWYLCQWIVDTDAKVYKFNPEINRAAHLPVDFSNWHYVLGCDLAHSPDSTGFVVGAYHESDPNLYLVYAKKHLKMDVTDAGTETNRLDSLFGFDVKVIDGANKMAVAEMNNRHRTGFIPADKTGKTDFINIMNADFIQGKIRLLPEAESIIQEYDTLVWTTDGGKVIEPKKEHPGIHNDLADAALYLWRHCYQWLWRSPEPRATPRPQDSWEPAHLAKITEDTRRKFNPTWLDINFDESLFDLDSDELL